MEPHEVHAQLAEQAHRMYPNVVAVGRLHWPDYAATVDGSDQGLVKFTKQEKQAMQDRAGGFPAAVALVVTPMQLFVCKYKVGRTGVKMDEVKGWNRDLVRCSVSYPYGSDDYARLELMTAERRIELDAADSNGVNRALVQAVVSG
jgi:hypothetical protein